MLGIPAQYPGANLEQFTKTSILGKLIYIRFGLLYLLSTTINLVNLLTSMASETEWQRVHPFSAEQGASLAHTRTWGAEIARQNTIAHELSRLAILSMRSTTLVEALTHAS
jgi:hypothetical protein